MSETIDKAPMNEELSLTIDLGGVVVSRDWHARFTDAPYDALLELPPDQLTPEFFEAIVTRPAFYFEGMSSKVKRWFHVRNTIDIFPDECLTEKAILTMFYCTDPHIGKFDVIRNTRVAARITTDMAIQIFENALSNDSYSKRGLSSMPKALITSAFIERMLPKYPYQLCGIIPTKLKSDDIYLKALMYNPACYGRLPRELKTTKRGENSLERILGRDDINSAQVRSVIKSIPDLNQVNRRTLHKVAAKFPGAAKLIADNCTHVDSADILKAAIKNTDLIEVRKAIDTTPTDILVKYLTLGFSAETEDNTDA